ncbi:glycosyltransferase family 39 protein [Candidatus Curtissbacteria bacterium]|nr:glycosyltransferase family 39 protein [Candidatus Curtissbacteria bacterium]
MGVTFKIPHLKFKIEDSRVLLLLAIVILALVLRFYKLNTNPPGLYWDEAVFGYDAYSILKTAHDHHGQFLPLFFESFGDWKLPVYHYLLIPSIAIFGLTEFAVRFPSALLGTATVIAIFLIVKKLTQNINLALFSAFFLAISPWHIQFSRGGFESTAGLFAAAFGTYLAILAIEKKNILYFSSSGILFVLSMYSYHAYRIFVPLFLIALLAIYRKELKSQLAKILPAIAIALLFLVPLAAFSLSAEGRARAISQSAFKKGEQQQARLDFDQKSKKPLRFMSKYLYQEPVYYSYVAAKGYIAHFSPTFLFFQGDQIGRHSQVDMGQIFLFEAVFIVAALFLIKFTSINKIMLAWLLLAPIPASIVGPTPHAYRTLQMAIPLAYLSGLGAHYLISRKNFLLPKIILGAFALYWFLSYLHLLFVHYPVKFAPDWQDGYRQMVEAIKKHQASFEMVYITNINQVPYIYLLFYQKYDPGRFIQLGGNRDGFDKYVFVSRDTDIYDKGRILYVAPSWEKVDGKWLDAVNDSGGRHIYSLWEVGGGK